MNIAPCKGGHQKRLSASGQHYLVLSLAGVTLGKLTRGQVGDEENMHSPELKLRWLTCRGEWSIIVCRSAGVQNHHKSSNGWLTGDKPGLFLSYPENANWPDQEGRE